MASSIGSLPFARVGPQNKRSRLEAFSKEYWAEDLETMIERTDPVLERFELYERGNNDSYTGRCMHFKVVFKASNPGRARARSGQMKGKRI